MSDEPQVVMPPADAGTSPDRSDERESAARRVIQARETRTRHIAVTTIVIVSATLGATAPVHPTASTVADAVLAGAFAAALSYGASRAHRWSWFVPTTAAAVLSDWPVLIPAVIALALTVSASWRPRRVRSVGALVGGLVAQSLLRLPDWEPFGTSALVVGLVTLPVFVSGLRALPTRRRRAIGLGVLAFGSVAVVLGGVAMMVAIAQRADVEAGIDAAQSGLDAAESGDDAVAIELLDEAATRFGAAGDAFGAPWLRPAKALPIVGQHVEALEVVSGEGSHLSRLASDAVAEADLDSLRFNDGVIDIGALEAIEPPLHRSATGLEVADDAVSDARSSWLVDPVRSRVDRFADQVSDASADADVALDAVRVAPALFGGVEDRRYLVLFPTLSEMRGLGGFLGNYGELTAVDGDVELTRSGRVQRDMRPPDEDPSYEISGPEDYLDRYGRFDPGRFLQDTTFSPDFPTVGTVWEEIYPQTPIAAPVEGRQQPLAGPLDGVIMVDPIGLAGLLEFTGPIIVDGLDMPLTADNAAQFLLTDQYLEFQADEAQRIDFLDEASRKTFEALTSGDIPGPQTVIDVLGPLVRGGHLAVHSIYDDEQALYERTGVAGAFPEVQGDFAGLTGQNAGNSKIDIFSERTIHYDAVVDPGEGRIDATVTIEVTNEAPADGLPLVVLNNARPDQPQGTNSTNLSWYSSLELESMTVEGIPVNPERARELDRNVFTHPLHIPPGESRTVVIELSGPNTGGDRYRLDVARQPTVNDDRLVVSVGAADGWHLTDVTGADVRDGVAVLDQPLTEDLVIEAGLAGD